MLQSRPYPGRGVLAARRGDDELVFVYFLTGRSAASRSRRLDVLSNGDVAVVDTTGVGEFDALRHYVAGAQRVDWVVVGNGDQVVPIAEALAAGDEPLAAWSSHTYEFDPPIFTSRIWAATRPGESRRECILGFARRSERRDAGVDRVAWSVELAPGTGVLMTTYDGTVDAVHATDRPVSVDIDAETVDGVLDEVWSALTEVRVAAFAVVPDRFRSGPAIR